MDCFASLAMTARMLSRTIPDRRLERQRSIPRKEDPGVLRHFGNERIDKRPALRLGVDGGKMRVGHHVAHQTSGLAGVDEIVMVAEDEIIEAMALLMTRAKLYVEGSGAAATAALVAGRVKTRAGARVVAIVSGGNADPVIAAGILASR